MQQRDDGRLAARWIILPILMHEYCSQRYYRRGLAGGGRGGGGCGRVICPQPRVLIGTMVFFRQHDAQRQMHKLLEIVWYTYDLNVYLD